MLRLVLLKVSGFLQILWLPVYFAISQRPLKQLERLPRFSHLASQAGLILAVLFVATKLYLAFELDRKTQWVIDSTQSAVCSVLSSNMGCFDSNPMGATNYNVDGHKALDSVMSLFSAIRLQGSLMGFSPENTAKVFVRILLLPLAIPLFSFPATWLFLRGRNNMQDARTVRTYLQYVSLLLIVVPIILVSPITITRQHYMHILASWPDFPKLSDPYEGLLIDGKAIYLGDVPRTVEALLSNELSRLYWPNVVCLTFIGIMLVIACYRVNSVACRGAYWRVVPTMALLAGFAVTLT